MTLSLDGPGTPIGAWVKLSVVESVEIMALAGFDFVVVDMEHGALDLADVSRLVAVAAARGLTPLVRVPDHGATTIQRVLDAGARGVLVPHVDTAAQAESVVRAMRFPPRGHRGAGGTGRAGRWGLLPRDEYVRQGDTAVLCVPQLESAEAIADAPAILAVDGVDAVFVGAADLALSLGDSRPVPALVDAALAAAARAGKPCGLATVTARQAADAARRGARFLLVGNDAGMLARTADRIAGDVRKELGSGA
ncbi:aldolase/citrate lyase family protein [Phytohabitans sp. ZYX-F-186]|uniref:Aldolase/citrate lyase family protein n=1 Tax=Phytohabitans maris TaxID=3071409 RepID=A0ABU0ZT34_9ACTN|nr:aldolase/citrate lyase family protein [Phytohabitans sp. ZYX-F-186]MDQ7910152.1 aldolase/citrate lyase family protein [Phytohabitans sp. ZYX-F-186]